MKRTGNLIAKIVELDNLQLAFFKARKGKDDKEGVLEYRKNLDENLRTLQSEILSGELKIGNYHYFTIYEPKERRICAASFPERVLHHALMNVCHPVFEKQQIFHSYATRKNKGTYAALHRGEKLQYKNKWFLKLDIRKYFDSISHQILFELLQRKFKDPHLLQIFNKIINSYQSQPKKGLPIGNLTSQYFANYYLSFADHFVQEELQIGKYVRYMDDMVLWSNDKTVLLYAAKELRKFLSEKLELELKICFLNKNKQALPFLGYHIFKTKTKLNPQSKQRFVKKAIKYQNNLVINHWTQEEYQKHILPLLSYTKYAQTKNLRKKLFEDKGD